MRCPRCNFEGEPLEGGCPRCGYGRQRSSAKKSSPLSQKLAMETSRPMTAVAVSTLGRGVSLRQGRYRIVEQIMLPKNQQDQGTAWLATDSQALSRFVVIREVNPPAEFSSNKEQAVRNVAQRLALLSQQPGFPSTIDMFSERDAYYIVLQYREGKRLSSLLEEHGGALPEHTAVSYGLQLCEMVRVLASQNPPMVHGAISPETVIISPDGKQVSLSMLPPFKPTDTTNLKSTAGYFAPEQFEGKVTTASDIYGLSATLHHSATGYDPSGRMAFFYPPARQVNPLISARLEHILIKGLHLKPSARYENPVQMRNALSNLLSTYPVTEKLSSRANDGLQSRSFQRRVQSRRSRASFMFSVVALVTILFLVSGILLAVSHSPTLAVFDPGASATATAQAQVEATVVAKETVHRNNEITSEISTYTSRGIGLSDGNLIFDTSDPKPTVLAADKANCKSNVDCKKQAAQAVQNGNPFIAATYLNSAVQADPTDAEALIYKENLNIFNNQLNSVTVIVGTNFLSPDNLTLQRSHLRAVYLAQFEINRLGLLPGGYQLRVLLANVRSQKSDIQTIADFINNRYFKPDAGNVDHIVAMIGWPSISQTLFARNKLSNLHIPLISPDSADPGSNTDPYFYHIIPSYAAQGQALGTIAVEKLKAKRVMILQDPADPQSVSLATAISKQVTQLGGKVVGLPRDVFSEKTTTADVYQQVIASDASSSNADVIVTTGTDIDGVRLTHALNAAAKDPVLQNLQVLVGNATGNLNVLQRNDTVAQLNPQSLQRLSFLSFGDLNAHTLLNRPVSTLQDYFTTDWKGTFQNSFDPAANAPDVDQNGMLTYDAVWAVGKALSQVNGPLTNEALQQMLHSSDAGHNAFSYQGTSGRIVFDSQGNPIDKAMYWQTIGSDNMLKLNAVFGTFQ